MEVELAEKLSEYRSILENDPRIKKLEEIESSLSKDEEVKALSFALKQKEEEFEEARSHYGEKSPLSKAAQKKLYEAKLALDQHPSYNKAYIAVKDLFLYIDDILFSDFRAKKDCASEAKDA